MLTYDQKDFYTRWTEKANSIVPAIISEYIDKYVTLFIIFNSLYNAIPAKLIAAGQAGNFSGDKNGATNNVIRFIGAPAIMAGLAAQNNDSDIAALIEVFEAKMFNIKLTATGNPVSAEDNKLEADLKSHDVCTKCLALLTSIYYIRCNIVHGRKNLQPYQEILLQPVTNILSSLNWLLYNALDQSIY